MSEVTEKRFVFQDAREMVAVLGETDEYLRQMQRSLGCQLIPRGNELIAQGKEQDVELAGKLIQALPIQVEQFLDQLPGTALPV